MSNTLPRMTYTMKEASTMLGLSYRTVRNMALDGMFRVVRIGNGPKARVLIPADELEAFVSGNKEEK